MIGPTGMAGSGRVTVAPTPSSLYQLIAGQSPDGHPVSCARTRRTRVEETRSP